MSDLDKKLTDICANYVDDAVDFSGYVKAIKQAFKDDNWVKLPTANEKDGVLYVNGVDRIMQYDSTSTAVTLMTGQEWYNKFANEMRKYGNLVGPEANIPFDAAKNASGIEHQQENEEC